MSSTQLRKFPQGGGEWWGCCLVPLPNLIKFHVVTCCEYQKFGPWSTIGRQVPTALTPCTHGNWIIGIIYGFFFFFNLLQFHCSAILLMCQCLVILFSVALQCILTPGRLNVPQIFFLFNSFSFFSLLNFEYHLLMFFEIPFEF